MSSLYRVFAPRWFVFVLDICCSFLAIFAAFFLRFNFDVQSMHFSDLEMILTVFLLINIAVFLIFKTYCGIIRYTSIEDTTRIILVNILVAGLLFLFDKWHYDNTSLIDVFSFSIVLIYYLAINFFMISYRLVVKWLFRRVFFMGREQTKAVVYDAQYEGRMVKKMLSEKLGTDMKIVAFLEDTDRLIGKVVENVPVMSVSKGSIAKLQKDGVTLLIVSNPHFNAQRLNQLVDWCLEYNIQIQQVPSSKKWLNNKLGANELKRINIEQLLEREVIHIENEQLSEQLEGKRILVTGAAGSIGSEIVKQLLLHKPSAIIACDAAETPLHDLKLSFGNEPRLHTFIGDVGDAVRMEQIFEIFAPDIVYHAAAYKHVPAMEAHPTEAICNNVLGTKTLAELSVAYGVERFVMVSTDKAVNPTNVMGASKRIAEIFIQSYYNFIKGKLSVHSHHNKENRFVTKFITTRFGNVLGSSGSVIPRFKQQIEDGGPVTVTHPEITRFFMTIPEACQLVLEAGAMGQGGEVFVFDMGEPVKIIDLARKMILLSGKIPNQDIKIAYCGLRPGEKLYEELLTNQENTLPTYHNKIMIARVEEFDYVVVAQKIERLINTAKKHIAMETVAIMKDIVPEFISNNSVYQKLDKDRNLNKSDN